MIWSPIEYTACLHRRVGPGLALHLGKLARVRRIISSAGDPNYGSGIETETEV
jgi:hypothetical protein